METLPPYISARLGAARSADALALRRVLSTAGISVPRWIDARPGRLQVIIGDCAGDPPLSRSARALALWHAETLLLGLGALGLAAGGARLVLVTRHAEVYAALLQRTRGASAVEVQRVPAAWPSQPELDVAGASGAAWVVPAASLDQAGTALRGEPPHRLITVAGAVRQPQVVPLAPGAVTPAELVRLCGGALTPAWVPLSGWPPRLWDPLAPLPARESLLILLPAGHPLVLRLRDAAPALATTGCSGCGLCTDACPVAPRRADLQPHHLIDAIARAGSLAAALSAGSGAAAQGCSGCGACDVVCPAGLMPGLWTGRLGELATAEAPAVDDDDGPGPASPHSALRRVPLDLVTAHYGLSAYDT